MGHEHIRPTRKVAWCIKVPTWTAKMEIQVQQDAVEAGANWKIIAAHVRRDESTMVALACVLDVTLVQIDTDVVRMRERRRVGPRSAPDVQHALDRTHVIVAEYLLELLPGPGSHPHAIGERVAQDSVDEIHCGASSFTRSKRVTEITWLRIKALGWRHP